MNKKKNLVILLISTIIIIVIILATLIITFVKNINEEEINPANMVGLSKYPYVYIENNTFNSKIIAGDSAPDDELVAIQNYLYHLMKNYEMRPDTLIQYKHLSGGLFDQNAIFIGTCNMEPYNKFVNLFTDCLSLEDNTAVMRIVETNNITIIELIGKDFKDTEEAITVLTNYQDYNLSGREVQIRNDENGKIFTRITG